ncbi:MAG: hypothetical protein HXN57_09200 [Prevotella oris]|nr:hypothetical protein [Segatella oris]
MKNDENCISAMAETEKSLKTAFQPLGNGENASKRLSNPLEAGRWMLKLNPRNVK